MSRRCPAALIATVLAALPTSALAQPAAPGTTAAALFEEAGKAQDRGAYDEACPRFAQVVALEPGKVGAKLALADCYEGAGKLGSALAAYQAAFARAIEIGDPRAKLAGDKIGALDAKVARLTIQVPEALRSLPGLSIRRGGEPLDPAQWGKAMPSDPGEHEIAVSAPGKKPWSTRVTVTAGAGAVLAIGVLEEAEAPVLAPPPALVPRAVEAVAPPPARAVPAWAWASGGLGVASLVGAVAFGVDQAGVQADFDANCKNAPRDPVACPARTSRLYRDFGLWLGLGAAGLGGLAAATIGSLVPPKRRGAQLRASFWIVPEGSGAALEGRF